jgi:hypothetical protein
MFRSVIQMGQNAIQTGLLLNGGAAIAILAFLGQIPDKKPDALPSLATCLGPFAVGALAITVTAGAAYLSQWFYAQEWRKLGLALNFSCVVLGVLAYLAFAWGVLNTAHTVADVFKATTVP